MLDRKQIETFIDAMLGSREIAVDCDGEVVSTPHAPLARAFVIARIGGKTPSHGSDVFRYRAKADAFAALLREVADELAPPTPAASPSTPLQEAVEAYLHAYDTDTGYPSYLRDLSAATDALRGAYAHVRP